KKKILEPPLQSIREIMESFAKDRFEEKVGGNQVSVKDVQPLAFEVLQTYEYIYVRNSSKQIKKFISLLSESVMTEIMFDPIAICSYGLSTYVIYLRHQEQFFLEKLDTSNSNLSNYPYIDKIFKTILVAELSNQQQSNKTTEQLNQMQSKSSIELNSYQSIELSNVIEEEQIKNQNSDNQSEISNDESEINDLVQSEYELSDEFDNEDQEMKDDDPKKRIQSERLMQKDQQKIDENESNDEDENDDDIDFSQYLTSTEIIQLVKETTTLELLQNVEAILSPSFYFFRMAKDSFGEHGIRMEIKLNEIAQNLHQGCTLQQLQRHALSVQLDNPEIWQEKGGVH
ncbi:MAG: hypothetical protein EZS28_039737, partial [Streblomastix strix]